MAVSADTLYLKLKGARERLCVAQMGDTLDDLDRMLLEEAILRIDEVATKRCEQWSRFDYPHDDNPAVCSQCLGSGRRWYMQGGPHGIGGRSKCDVCNGTGKPVGGDS